MATAGFFDSPRNVVLISPQPWDGFQVSKHHYASELAALGHRVWFIEPPDAAGRRGAVTVSETDVAGVRAVRYTPWFPYRLKFHARALFNAGMRRQAWRLVKRIGARPDIVWDFDNAYQFADLRAFRAPLTIYHPVDNLGGQTGTKHADAVFSVDQTFLGHLDLGITPHRVIGHGLARVYETFARSVITEPRRVPSERPVTVGYVGNLAHTGVDWDALATMAEENPACLFRFIGPVPVADRSCGLADLEKRDTVLFEGRKTPPEIAALADEIDIWLVCYDPAKTIDGATNSHKVLEYLASGNPVLTNRIAAYTDSDLVVMPETNENDMLPWLLREMIATLDAHQAPELRRARAEFALGHSYESNLREIDLLIQARLDRTG